MNITAYGTQEELNVLHDELAEHGIDIDGDAFITSAVTDKLGKRIMLEIDYKEVCNDL